MKDLTTKQRKFYEWFTNPKNWELRQPTLVKCAKHMGVKSDNTIWKMMEAIKAKGYELRPLNKSENTLDNK